MFYISTSGYIYIKHTCSIKLGLASASSSAATIILEPFLVAISKGVCPSCKGRNEYLFHAVVSVLNTYFSQSYCTLYVIPFSVKLIIMQARWAVMVRLYLYVCPSITSLWLKSTGLHIVYMPFQHVSLIMDANVMEVKDWEDRERVQRHKRLLTAQKIDERRQNNGDRRQFVC